MLVTVGVMTAMATLVDSVALDSARLELLTDLGYADTRPPSGRAFTSVGNGTAREPMVGRHGSVVPVSVPTPPLSISDADG